MKKSIKKNKLTIGIVAAVTALLAVLTICALVYGNTGKTVMKNSGENSSSNLATAVFKNKTAVAKFKLEFSYRGF